MHQPRGPREREAGPGRRGLHPSGPRRQRSTRPVARTRGVANSPAPGARSPGAPASARTRHSRRPALARPAPRPRGPRDGRARRWRAETPATEPGPPERARASARPDPSTARRLKPPVEGLERLRRSPVPLDQDPRATDGLAAPPQLRSLAHPTGARCAATGPPRAQGRTVGPWEGEGPARRSAPREGRRRAAPFVRWGDRARAPAAPARGSAARPRLSAQGRAEGLAPGDAVGRYRSAPSPARPGGRAGESG